MPKPQQGGKRARGAGASEPQVAKTCRVTLQNNPTESHSKTFACSVKIDEMRAAFASSIAASLKKQGYPIDNNEYQLDVFTDEEWPALQGSATLATISKGAETLRSTYRYEKSPTSPLAARGGPGAGRRPGRRPGLRARCDVAARGRREQARRAAATAGRRPEPPAQDRLLLWQPARRHPRPERAGLVQPVCGGARAAHAAVARTPVHNRSAIHPLGPTLSDSFAPPRSSRMPCRRRPPARGRKPVQARAVASSPQASMCRPPPSTSPRRARPARLRRGRRPRR